MSTFKCIHVYIALNITGLKFPSFENAVSFIFNLNLEKNLYINFKIHVIQIFKVLLLKETCKGRKMIYPLTFHFALNVFHGS